MKVAIISFSPSGSTASVAKMLGQELQAFEVQVQFVEIARNKGYFWTNNKTEFLRQAVLPHDVLVIGSPVYAHHLHYNVKELIGSLPQPRDGWGVMSVPFVTWGGINSGVSLWEAGKLLKRSNRITIAGMKINSCHALSKLKKIRTKVNEGMPGEEALPVVRELADRIRKVKIVNPHDCADITSTLEYQTRKVKIKANLIFREKLWQRHIYPEVKFDIDKCKRCGLCVKACPVQRLEMKNGTPVITKYGPPCIHCTSCILECPSGARTLEADWERWNELLSKAASGVGPLPSNEYPKSAVYPQNGSRDKEAAGRALK